MTLYKKIIIIGGSLATVIILINIVLFRYINSPVSGSIIKTQAQTQTVNNSQLNINPVAVSGKYINFSYPSSFVSIQTSTNQAIVEDYSYQYKSTPQTWMLVFSVNRLSVSSINYDSAYSFRIKNPSLYSLNIETIGSNKFYIFKSLDKSSFNETAVVFNGNLSTDISLSGISSKPSDLQEIFNLSLNSFSWK